MRPRIKRDGLFESPEGSMKRIAFLVLIVLAAGAAFAGIFSAPDSDDRTPEFYFTRLAYTQNGSRGWGRWLGPDFRCPEFGGGNFFPPQSNGWGMDYPGADCKFMGG